MKKIYYGIKGGVMIVLIATFILFIKCAVDPGYRKTWYKHIDNQ